MSDLGKDRSAVLHIGWWRSGYHPYDQAEEPTMEPVTLEPTGPPNHEIRTRGALTAALICAAWVIVGAVGWTLLVKFNSAVAAVPALMALGGLAALPASAWLGWRYAHDARTGKSFWRMTGWTVLLSDLVVVVALEATVAIAVVLNHDPNWIAGLLGAIPVAIAMYITGLLIFGLPGLILAIPSSWYWEHAMRRAFNWTTPADGAPGSGDRPRS